MRTPQTLCDNCARLARGYWYQRDESLPLYAACSSECLEAIFANAKGHNGVIDNTEMEKNAIAAARYQLADALMKLDLLEPFEKLSPDQVDFLIESVWNGCRKSMMTQSALGEIPF